MGARGSFLLARSTLSRIYFYWESRSSIHYFTPQMAAMARTEPVYKAGSQELLGHPRRCRDLETGADLCWPEAGSELEWSGMLVQWRGVSLLRFQASPLPDFPVAPRPGCPSHNLHFAQVSVAPFCLFVFPFSSLVLFFGSFRDFLIQNGISEVYS